MRDDHATIPTFGAAWSSHDLLSDRCAHAIEGQQVYCVNVDVASGDCWLSFAASSSGAGKGTASGELVACSVLDGGVELAVSVPFTPFGAEEPPGASLVASCWAPAVSCCEVAVLAPRTEPSTIALN